MDSSRFPILMYHALYPALKDAAALQACWQADPQLADPGARHYALDAVRFDRQLAAITRADYRTPASLDELSVPAANRIVLTFDDGHCSNVEIALPALRARGLRAVFFITTDWIGRPGFMTPEQIRALDAAGMLLGSHGASHRYFADLSPAELENELRRSAAALESILGRPVDALALPGGRNHPRLPALAARLGYRHVFTSRVALANPATDSSNSRASQAHVTSAEVATDSPDSRTSRAHVTPSDSAIAPLAWPRIPITAAQPDDFLPRLLAGDTRQLQRMATRARLTALAKHLLGNRLYDTLRQRLMR